MNTAAIFHRTQDNWCYPLDNKRLHIRLQTALDVDSVEIVTGDPFDWHEGKWTCDTHDLRRCGQTALHQYWEAEVAPKWKRTKYYFVLHSGTQVWEYSERGLLVQGTGGRTDQHRNAFNFPYINEADLYAPPPWVESTVWYQVFPDRFANGRPAINPPGTKPWHRGAVTNRELYGGDLPGVVSKLDHIAELGCNGLYLTPIFQSPSVHKYDTTDYLRIDPAFGNEDDLRALVKGCHDRGIRLILDAVFNHSGVLFGPWQDVLTRREASRFRGWFHIEDFAKLTANPLTWNRDLGYATFAFAAGMPKLNTADSEVQDYLLRATEYWMDFGIDGWRLDVANEVDHDFWRRYRKVVKAKNPEAFIVGEIWHDSMPWLRGDQYDAVMNYRYGNAVSDFVLGLNHMESARDFAQALDGIDISYPLPVLRCMFNILDSHDTDRFLTRCGGNKARARLGWVLLFLLRGSPCVYYGSEVGMEGGHDPDNRRCMVWEPEHQDLEQFAFLQKLARLRVTEVELINRGHREWVLDDAEPDVLGLRIGGQTPTQRSLTLTINRSAQPRRGLTPWGFKLDLGPTPPNG